MSDDNNLQTESGIDPAVLARINKARKTGDARRSEESAKSIGEMIAEKPKPKSTSTNHQQYFLFPDDYYGTQITALPTEIARSAVFRVNRGGKERNYFTAQTPIAVMGDQRMMYAGPELDQADADCWLQVLKQVKGKPMGEAHKVEISVPNFLSSIGRPSGGTQYTWLKDSLDRLAKAKLFIENEDAIGSEKFIASSYSLLDYDFNGHSLTVWIPERSYQLFKNLSYVDWEKRFSLEKRVDLAKAIQLFASSHKRGTKRSVNLEELKNIVGYLSPLNKFRIAVADALQELERVGILENTWLSPDPASKIWRCGWYLPDMKND